MISGVESAVGVATLKNGTIALPFFHEIVKKPVLLRPCNFPTYFFQSRDDGKSWSGDSPIELPMREPIPYGRIVELPDGRLLYPVWEPGSWVSGSRPAHSSLVTGAGIGENYTRIAFDPKAGCRPDNGFNETSIALLPAGTLLAILRQQRVGEAGGPCDTYTEPSQNFYRSVSRDSGRTWSAPERLSLIGTSPALRHLRWTPVIGLSQQSPRA